jgi:hypothetical protein
MFIHPHAHARAKPRQQSTSVRKKSGYISETTDLLRQSIEGGPRCLGAKLQYENHAAAKQGGRIRLFLWKVFHTIEKCLFWAVVHHLLKQTCAAHDAKQVHWPEIVAERNIHEFIVG